MGLMEMSIGRVRNVVPNEQEDDEQEARKVEERRLDRGLHVSLDALTWAKRELRQTMLTARS